jgi:hypothetical protein
MKEIPPQNKNPFRIKYRNEHGAKLFQFGIDDSIVDDWYSIKSYGSFGGTTIAKGTTEFLDVTNTVKGMRYVKCNTDSFYKLKARYQ